MDHLKKVPTPIWIGLVMVVIVIFLSNKSSSAPPETTPGPVTSSTVGTQGTQSNAGTDQQLGNISQINQGGFAQILDQEQAQTDILQQLANNMNGIGTPMQQFGGSIQHTQNQDATLSATLNHSGQPVASHPSNGNN